MILFRISDCLTLLFVFFVWLQWMINFRIHMKILFTTNMKRWQKVGGAVEAHRKECFKRHRNIIETFRCVICNLRLELFRKIISFRIINWIWAGNTHEQPVQRSGTEFFCGPKLEGTHPFCAATGKVISLLGAKRIFSKFWFKVSGDPSFLCCNRSKKV